MLDVQDMSATLDGMDMTFSYGDSNGNPVTVSIYDGDVEEKNISCVSSSSSGINSTIIVTRKNCASSKDENMAAATHNYADDSRTEVWVGNSLSYYDDVCMEPPKNSFNVEHSKNNNMNDSRKEVWVENSLGYDTVYNDETSKIIYTEDSSTDVWVDNSLSYDDIYMNPVGSYSIPCDVKFLIPESVQNQKQ